jgi:uncharacterized protein YueI
LADVNDRLEQGMYGPKKLNPDEQNKFMGTFRERVYLTMTIDEMKSEAYQNAFEKELEADEDLNVAVSLNGEMDSSLQTKFMKICARHNKNYTLVNNNVSTDPDSFGLVLAGKDAVNIEKVDVAEKFPDAFDLIDSKDDEKHEKKPGVFGGLFKKLFTTTN